MSLNELVARIDDRLTVADRRLVDVLLANPRDAVFLSANEIAQRAGVNPATAVRFARKLGFGGYPELRATLRQDLLGVSEAAERMRQRIRRVARGSVLKTFVESEIHNLGRLLEQVADADIQPAARAIMRASQIFLFAVGHAGALAHLLDSRLGRAGYRTRIMKHVPRDMAAELLQARARDVFILFAFNEVHPLVAKIVAHARAAGAVCILVTDIPAQPVRPVPDIVLAATRGADGDPRSLSVPMAICNALVLHLSRLNQRKTLVNLEQLDKLRRKLDAAG
jgi:DNA-binding MurR/RpiR family transcriptional regulator